MRDTNSNPWKSWRKWDAAERTRLQLLSDLARVRVEVTRLENSMFWALVRQYAEDRGFLRALSRYNGHSPYGWKVACGPDGRIASLVDKLGWTRLEKLIEVIKRRKGW